MGGLDVTHDEQLTTSFIGGESVDADQSYENIDPSTGKTLGYVARASEEHVDRAVSAAREAHSKWRSTPPERRADALCRLGELIARDAERLARLECEDSGKPLAQARTDARICARYFQFYGHAIDAYYGLSIPLRKDLHIYTLREPYGVSGHIIAWNYPLQLFARGVAPSLAAGNCALVKPADETPRTAVAVARLALEAGLPPGAVNVVTGLGPEVGAAVALHPGIDHLGFVGSTRVGSLVATAAAERVAPVLLELGGKSAHVVFDDADIEKAARVASAAILQNAGQTCSAGSRILVHAKAHAELVERIAANFAQVKIGPGVEDPDLGPLISRKQQERVSSYVNSITSGDVLFGGSIAEPNGIVDGAYFMPTLIDGVDPGSAIAREEIFGPVLTSMSFSTEDEAIALANGTEYALLGAVWTKDLSRAHRVAREIRAGQVYVNTYGAGGGVELPFGGFSKSGYGREKGIEALDAYTATKTVIIEL
jgi:aldehyde dehydrogenase (NAD+)/betaine-aldehyde dehydrogenase